MLQSLHTLLLREHNRKARSNYALNNARNTSQSDEEIYQRARSWTIGLFQKISVYEYLPDLIGESLPTYTDYKITINPQVDTDFIGAAYRYGHSAVSGVIMRVDENGFKVSTGHLEIHQHFFQTWWN
jgi:hypothetical protein